MKTNKITLQDGLFAMTTLMVAFLLNLCLLELFNTKTMTPMIFVLGVFLVSLKTQGYFWGITVSLISVLAVNWAFTYPYWAFDLISPECISAAVVMLIVAIMTSALTTKLKQQEKMKAEAEKERMRGNLLRAVSHDLRTPLTSIYGACSAMIENYDHLSRETQLRLLKDIRADSQWLVRMVENLLSITRIDSGTVQIVKVSTALDELIDSVLVKFYKHYPDHRILLELPEELVLIPMDAMLVEQVLINLLENAVLHGKGLTQIRISVSVDGDLAVFEVRDNGCGIPQEKLARLFTGYFGSNDQMADQAKRNAGIGLSLCATIIRAHGGVISAENDPAGGAVFRFTMNTEETTDEQ